MHSLVTSKNESWPRLIWPTLYIWLHCVLSTLQPARRYQHGAAGPRSRNGPASCDIYRW